MHVAVVPGALAELVASPSPAQMPQFTDPVPQSASELIPALERNLALQRKHGVMGTPSLVFEDNERVAGVLDKPALEKKFASLRRTAR